MSTKRNIKMDRQLLRPVLFFLLPAVMAAGGQTAQAETFVIPHFVAGRLDSIAGLVDRRFATRFSVVNQGSAETAVTIEAFDAAGDRVDATVFGPTKVAPNGLGQYFVDSLTLVSGWLRITTGQPALVRGSIVFLQLDSFDVSVVSGFPTMAFASTEMNPSSGFLNASVPVVSYAGGGTGITLSFPSASGREASATLTLRDPAGRNVGQSQIKISSNGSRTFRIEEVFPQIKEQKTGVLTVQSLSALYGVAVEFQESPFWMSTVEFGAIQ